MEEDSRLELGKELMITIFMDESGYTCPNLLDTKQPIFTLATLKCSEQEAQNFRAEFFSEVRAAELHHVKMRKSYNQQQMIIKFLQALLNNSGSVKVKVIHKRYALYYKLVETIIVPAARKEGIDLYKDGQIIDFTNFFYYDFPNAGGTIFAENLLRKFQEMMDELELFSFNRFFWPILNEKYKQPYETMMHNIDEQRLDFFLWNLQKGYDSLGFQLIELVRATYRPLKMHPLDLGLGSAMQLMESWRRDISESISLVHDESSKMATSVNVWKSLVDSSLPPKTIRVGYGNLSLIFPIGIQESLPEKSNSWVGLQLVDILAGAVNQWAKWVLNGRKQNNNDDEYSKRLDEVIPLFPIMTFWPSPDIQLEERRTSYEDSIAERGYFGQILEKHYLEYSEEVVKKLEAMKRLQEAGAQFMYRVY